jgi:hypothetical protein
MYISLEYWKYEFPVVWEESHASVVLKTMNDMLKAISVTGLGGL